MPACTRRKPSFLRSVPSPTARTSVRIGSKTTMFGPELLDSLVSSLVSKVALSLAQAASPRQVLVSSPKGHDPRDAADTVQSLIALWSRTLGWQPGFKLSFGAFEQS